MEQSPTVIYICGYGRSGSSVLDATLGNAKSVFGAGELSHLFGSLAEPTSRCTCGASLRHCDIWGQIDDAVRTEFNTLDYSAAQRLTYRFQTLGLSLPRQASLYRRLWRFIFNRLSLITGSPVIVDSSKSARRSAWRPLLLAELCDLDVTVLHLVRHPLGVLYSSRRGSNRSLSLDNDSTPNAFRPVRTLVGWTVANLTAERLAARLPSLSGACTYEDFVTDPAQALRTLDGRLTTLPLLDLADQLTPETRLNSGHAIAGNRARYQPTFQLTSDVEWLGAASPYLRALATLAHPVARRYGFSRNSRNRTHRQDT